MGKVGIQDSVSPKVGKTLPHGIGWLFLKKSLEVLGKVVYKVISLTYHQKGNSSLTHVMHGTYVIHLTSSHHIGILSSYIIKTRRLSIVQ